MSTEEKLRLQIEELKEELKYFEEACNAIVTRNANFKTHTDAHIAINAVTIVSLLREQRQAMRKKEETCSKDL